LPIITCIRDALFYLFVCYYVVAAHNYIQWW